MGQKPDSRMGITSKTRRHCRALRWRCRRYSKHKTTRQPRITPLQPPPHRLHRPEHPVPRLLVLQYGIGKHTPVPADVANAVPQFTLIIVQPLATAPYHIQLAVGRIDRTMSPRLVVRAAPEHGPVGLRHMKIEQPRSQCAGHYPVRLFEFLFRVPILQQCCLGRIVSEQIQIGVGQIGLKPERIRASRPLPGGAASLSRSAWQPSKSPLLQQCALRDPPLREPPREKYPQSLPVFSTGCSAHSTGPAAESIRMTPQDRTPCAFSTEAYRHAVRTASTNRRRSSWLPMALPPNMSGYTGATTEPTPSPSDAM